MVSVVIKKSDKPGKKLVAIFTRDNGRTKKTYFGASGMEDYTITKDKEQRKRYRSRHKKDLSTGDYTRAGYLSWHILWGDSTSRKENIASYKRRFNLR
mgnify:CR=1 FL=1|jgi:hypothetical protein|tara:strand:- start:177 stop:470 length:294 start_codon:yes stop_codon:yes gene_type:complete